MTGTSNQRMIKSGLLTGPPYVFLEKIFFHYKPFEYYKVQLL